MTDFSKATPRPWHVTPTAFQEGYTVSAQPSPVMRGFSKVVAYVGDGAVEGAQADAALIVEAVNSYDANKALIAELVEALEDVLPLARPKTSADSERMAQARVALLHAHAAKAKAVQP